ncbi:MAG: thermonuclease family protein [Patescibacteria group bacterium]
MTKRRALLALLSSFIAISILVLMAVQAVSREWPGHRYFGGLFWKQAVISEPEAGRVRVGRVIDGDTIELSGGDTVRYIGIDAPESVDPRRAAQCFGKEAAEFNKHLVAGKEVRLEKDISDRDKYGRLLRYVYLEDGTLANEMLVREGYAFVATYPPDVAKKDIFRTAERTARSEERGLWSETTCGGKK